MFNYPADDLEEDEVEYELCLRGTTPEGTLADKRRLLRNHLYHDRRTQMRYMSAVTLDDEYPIIDYKIKQLDELLQKKITPRVKSRLLCLQNRISRAPTHNAGLKTLLKRRVTEMIEKYFGISGDLRTEVITENESPMLEPPILDPRRIDLTRPSPQGPTLNTSFANPTTASSPTAAQQQQQPTRLYTQSGLGNGFQNNNRTQNLNTGQTTQQCSSTQNGQTIFNRSLRQHPANAVDFRPTLNNSWPNGIQSTTNQTTDPTLPLPPHIPPPPPSFRPPVVGTQLPSRTQPHTVTQHPTDQFNTGNLNQQFSRLSTNGHQPGGIPSRHNSQGIAGDFSLPLRQDDGEIPAHSVPTNENGAITHNSLANFPGNWQEELRTFIKTSIKDAIRVYVDEWSSLPTPNVSGATHDQHTVRNQGMNTSLPYQVPTNEQQNRGDSYSGHNHLNNQSSFPSQYYNHLRAKIEKWGIHFSGEINTKSLTASEFVRQVSILANANRVTDEELLRQAYIFFVGEARKWYFTYCEDFYDWNDLVRHLMIDFENPNKDKAIEDEMRERKQKPFERFSAYLADMERLSKSLTYRMNEQRKYRLIFDNTKHSYRRRLATVRPPIRTVSELAEYCYEFDALEPSLYATNPQRSHNQGIHQINLDDQEDDLEMEEQEINAIGSNQKFGIRNRNQKSKFVKNNATNTVDTDASQEIGKDGCNAEMQCWNCNISGHIAKNCEQPRKIYCYACGEPNFTTRSCPKQHKANEDQKN